MATGSDVLLEHLLFQVALSGSQGFSITALSDAFIEHNENTHVDEDEQEDEDDGDLLFSLKPPGAKSDANSQASDPQHLEKLWIWLVDHPDVTVKQVASSKDEKASAAPNLLNPLTPVFIAHANERLFTTDHRIWHALTDHDVDWKRIPKLEFICLQVIAAAGRQGILQPDVTRLTGQDKRSVPKRTDALASKGYITKEMCLGGGIKTSLLRLKKLSREGPASTYMVVKGEAGKGVGGTRRMINYEQWFSEVITNLKKHQGLVAYEDLRKEMGIHGLRWETRALHRCVKRLEKAGCVQRLKARLENARRVPDAKGKKRRRRQSSHDNSQEEAEDAADDAADDAPSKDDPEKVSWIRCIKLMREPVEKDKEAFVSTVKGSLSKTGGGQEDSDADAEVDADEDDDYVEIDAAALDGLGKMAEITKRIPPQWQPSMHHTQFVFNVVASAGTKGLSTMELANVGLGHFWRRPLDELLGRLTDVWTASQPLHLRHLAIIRDTSQLHRISHYVFRSYGNFQKLVDNGEAAWEAIGINPAELQRKPELDAWGFPKVKPSTMVGHDGVYNMAACRNIVIKSKGVRPLFKKHETALYTPKPRTALTPSKDTPSAQAANPRATSPIDDDETVSHSTSKPKRKQYKELFRMNPKRVEAELKAWKARSHKLAVSKAKQELGLSIQNDGPRPKKRRRTTKTANVAVENVPEPLDSKLSILADAAAAVVPATQLDAASGALQGVDGSSTVTTITNQTAEQPKGTGLPEHAQPPTQPVVQPSAEADNTSAEQFKANSILDQRVAEIEDEILNMSKPGIYINPPGSGQAKNDIVQPKGRPSRYLVAVFKSEKLKSIPWFNQPSEYFPQPRSRSVTATPEPVGTPEPTTPASASTIGNIEPGNTNNIGTPAETPASQATRESPEPREEIIIKKGRRIQVQRQGKRKAYEPLRQKVTKKLAVESSVEQFKWRPVSQLEQAYSSHTPSKSSAKSPPQTPSRRAVPVENTPSKDASPLALQWTEASTASPAIAPNFSTEDGTKSHTPEVDYVQLQAQNLVSMAESEAQTVSGATDEDIQMKDAPIDSSEQPSLQPSGLQRDIEEAAPLQTQPQAPQEVSQTASQPTFASTPSKIMAPFMRRAIRKLPQNNSPDKTTENLPATPAMPSRHNSLLPESTLARASRAKAPTKVGVGRSGGIVSYNRTRVILEIVNKNGGMFGGERELYYPFVTVWDREFQRRPDRHTLDRVLATLVDEGRLKRVPFSFTATSGQLVSKTIVMEPHIDPHSPEVQDLKNKISEYYPMSYVPETVDVAPDLRVRIEHDSRSGKPYDGNTIRTFFVEDPTLSVTRIEGPQKVQLGMTEARMQKGVSARRRRREEEERRQQRYMQAQMEEEIDEAVAALTTDFQLDSYEHDPDRATVDRGPRGRGRLAKLQRWGAEEQSIPKRALGLLTANGQDDGDAMDAEQNSRDAVAASDFGLMRTQEAPDPPEYEAPNSNMDRRVRIDVPSGRSASLSQILQNQKGTFSVIEALSMTSPYQRFHSHSGTFSTDPVVITTSNKHSQHGFVGQQIQIPKSLADIFKQAGEEATLLRQPAQSLQTGQHEVPQFAAVGVTRLPRLHSARPRPPPKQLSEYKAYGHKAILPRATRQGIFSMSDKEEQRLIYAVVVVKTLTGGLEQIINWGLVHQVFHYKFDPNYCRHRWVFLKPKLGGTADKLQVEFQKLFLEAYERGELPPIDFVEPEQYDWLAIVEWAEARLSRTNVKGGLPDLPKSRETLDKRFEVKNATEIHNVPREDFWVANVTHLRREELANSWSFIRPLSKSSGPPAEDGDLMLALSWVRANVVTPDAVYDGNKAHARLSRIENQLPKALDHLLGAKVIRMENKGRQIPGRNYDISDQVLTMFKRQWDVRFLKLTAAYKKSIDAAFATDGKFAISYQATDPEMTAMTNLISAGRAKVVHVLPRTDHTYGAPFPRLTKWGFTEGNYKTVHMDKTRLHFGLELVPTEKYVYGTPISLPPPPLHKHFSGEVGPRLPLWTDIHGDLIPVYWEMTLMATLWLLAFRPGLKASDMARNAYKGKLWIWELEMFLAWAESANVAKKVQVVEGEEAGWMVDEWWWLSFAEA